MSERALITLLLVCLVWPAAAVAAEQLRDPTRPSWLPDPGRQQRPVVTRYRLESVLIAAERRVAVINGRVVTVGDVVDGAAVLSIEPEAVTLRRDGRELVLKLLPGSVKTTS